MYTQCPQCKTIFPFSQLKINQSGKTQCNQCKFVFEANAHLVSTYQVPEQDTERLQVGDQALDARSEAELLHALEEEEKIKIKKRRRAQFWWFVIALLFAGALAGQYFWIKHPHKVLQHEKVRPVLDSICDIVGCRLPATRDIFTFQVMKKHINPHRSHTSAVTLQFMFKNTAHFAQPYPGLEVRFKDANGTTIGMRQLLPQDYLVRWEDDKEIPADGTVNVSLDLMNNVEGLHSYGYKISFF